MRHALLTSVMDDAWLYVHALLRDLSDQEFYWEPVADCWTIRRTENGTWTYDRQRATARAVAARQVPLWLGVDPPVAARHRNAANSSI